MYKDKDKQREANRERQRRYKAKQKALPGRGVTQGVTSDTGQALLDKIFFGSEDCGCLHCRTNRANGNRYIINHGPYKIARQLGDKELNRVSLPGDIDYDGVCLNEKYKDRWIRAAT